MTKCPYCTSPAPSCIARYPKRLAKAGELRLWCVLEKNHAGPHVSCGDKGHELQTWENDDER